MTTSLLVAFALMLVLEGLVPFLAPVSGEIRFAV